MTGLVWRHHSESSNLTSSSSSEEFQVRSGLASSHLDKAEDASQKNVSLWLLSEYNLHQRSRQALKKEKSSQKIKKPWHQLMGEDKQGSQGCLLSKSQVSTSSIHPYFVKMSSNIWKWPARVGESPMEYTTLNWDFLRSSSWMAWK